MDILRRAGLAALVMVTLGAPSWAVAQTVRLDATAQARLGIRTIVVRRDVRRDQVAAFAKVLDPGPLAQLLSDLDAAEAAAGASSREARRLAELHAAGQAAAAKDVEAASAQARQDASRARLLRRRLGLEWGAALAAMKPAARSRLVDALANGHAALVHLDSPSNAGQSDATSADVDIGDASLRAAILGPARAAEPRLQSSGLLGVVYGSGAVRLSNGLTQSARLNLKTPVAGVLVPSGALVRAGGADWVYVRVAPGVFQRTAVGLGPTQPDGVFVRRGLDPGATVAVAGVGALITADPAEAAGR